jgi:hypothetical protein
MSAQSAQIALAWTVSRAIAATASAQICEQSISKAMHLTIILTSVSCKQEIAQWLQAMAQALQASIHALYGW